MEDAHAAVLDLDGENSDSSAFFAVYDGHGGMHILSDRVSFSQLSYSQGAMSLSMLDRTYINV